jgi:hypothetical protein
MVRTVLVGLVTLGLVGLVHAAPDKAPERDLEGTYACEGTNPDGKTYTGVVDIIKFRDTYLVRWTMPDDSQVVGVGIFTGSMFSVSYFGGTPALVVYSLAENGQLDGTWTAEGEVFRETLTKMPEGAARPPKPTKRETRPRSRITV